MEATNATAGTNPAATTATPAKGKRTAAAAKGPTDKPAADRAERTAASRKPVERLTPAQRKHHAMRKELLRSDAYAKAAKAVRMADELGTVLHELLRDYGPATNSVLHRFAAFVERDNDPSDLWFWRDVRGLLYNVDAAHGVLSSQLPDVD